MMPYKDRDQQREFNRKWVAARRTEWLADKVCAVCGSTVELEVDHIDPSKKVEHRVWSWSKERRNEELAKCQVLCREHHRGKSVEDDAKKWIRSTNTSGYRGVSRKSGKWQAGISVGGRSIHLGLFEKKEDAAQAYLTAFRSRLV